MRKKRHNTTVEHRAALYLRVSTAEQAAYGVSLQAQEERLRAYAAANALEVVAVVREEGVSAFKPLAERPGGQDLLALVEGGKVSHVVALKLDRLFRNAVDALTTVQDWDRMGVALHIVDLGGTAINTHTAIGRFFLTMLAGFAELERNMIAERTTLAMAYKKARKEKYAPVPFGFRENGSRLEPDPAELEAVRLIQELRAQGWSLRAIAQELNRLEVRTKRGGRRWYASTVRAILGNDLHVEAV